MSTLKPLALLTAILVGNRRTRADRHHAIRPRDRHTSPGGARNADVGNADVGNAYGRDAWGFRGYADDGHDADDDGPERHGRSR